MSNPASHPDSKPTLNPTPAKPGTEKKSDLVFVWPHLVTIEAIAAIVTLFMLSLVATFVNAPLLGIANPEVTPNPAKAPWYFLGLQELLLHMHPSLAGVILPTLVLVLLAAIPYYDRDKRGTGIWFSTAKGIPITIFSMVYTAIWEIGLIIFDEYFYQKCITFDTATNTCEQTSTAFKFGFDRYEGAAHGIGPWMKAGLGLPAWTAEILMPSVIMIFIPVWLWRIVKRRYNANTRELMIAMFSFFLASFIVLTIVGTAFRGQSMALVWPWQLTPPIE